MDLSKHAKNKKGNFYDSISFLTVYESRIPYMKANGLYEIVNVTEHQQYKHEGAFFDVLDDLNIPKQLHTLVLMFNNMYCQSDYKGKPNPILIPDENHIKQLAMFVREKKRQTN